MNNKKMWSVEDEIANMNVCDDGKKCRTWQVVNLE